MLESRKINGRRWVERPKIFPRLMRSSQSEAIFLVTGFMPSNDSFMGTIVHGKNTDGYGPGRYDSFRGLRFLTDFEGTIELFNNKEEK